MKKKRSIFSLSSGIVAGIATIIVAVALVASSLAGYVDPALFPIAGVVVMIMPVVFPVALVLFVADALWWRRPALIMGLAMAVSMPAIVDTFPVGTGGFVNTRCDKENWPRITMLSFNCAGWIDLTGEYKNGLNPAAEMILSTNADIVVLQESDSLVERKGARLTQALVDTLHLRYPYVIDSQKRRLTLLSKFPSVPVPTPNTELNSTIDEIAAYDIDIYSQHVTLFSVHLHSIGLTVDDKALYEDVTNLDDRKDYSRSTISKVRHELIGKLSAAAATRSRQVGMLGEYILNRAGENVIVCGDFNDVPSCYALSRLRGLGLREVYPAVGKGYMSTFNRNRFWFRIDHVLWRGAFRPMSMKRIHSMCSDHYALLTEFAVVPR